MAFTGETCPGQGMRQSVISGCYWVIVTHFTFYSSYPMFLCQHSDIYGGLALHLIQPFWWLEHVSLFHINFAVYLGCRWDEDHIAIGWNCWNYESSRLSKLKPKKAARLLISSQTQTQDHQHQAKLCQRQTKFNIQHSTRGHQTRTSRVLWEEGSQVEVQSKASGLSK